MYHFSRKKQLKRFWQGKLRKDIFFISRISYFWSGSGRIICRNLFVRSLFFLIGFYTLAKPLKIQFPTGLLAFLERQMYFKYLYFLKRQMWTCEKYISFGGIIWKPVRKWCLMLIESDISELDTTTFCTRSVLTNTRFTRILKELPNTQFIYCLLG